MKYFPVNLNIGGRKVLVVGGGEVAFRKVMGLAACGACVTVISPSFCGGLVRVKGIKRIRRPYRKADLKGMCLVVSATDSKTTNQRVWEHASSNGIPVNVVDQPDLCTFTVPAVVRKGDLLIAVSTGGGSPALAGRIRKHIEKNIDPVFAQHLKLLKEMRPKVLASALTPEKRARLLKRMAGDEVQRVIKKKGIKPAKRLLQDMFKADVG